MLWFFSVVISVLRVSSQGYVCSVIWWRIADPFYSCPQRRSAVFVFLCLWSVSRFLVVNLDRGHVLITRCSRYANTLVAVATRNQGLRPIPASML